MVVEAVTGAPDVETLHTRAIDDRSIIRGFVRSTELSDSAANGLTLRTDDSWSTGLTDWKGNEPVELEPTSGALRIEAVSDDVVRIRYVPGAAQVDEADRDLGIVVGTLASPTDVEIDGTTIRTPAMVVEVGLSPFSVRISTPDGVERCR